MSSRSAALRKRLSGYWKMELGNVLLVPGIMLWLAYLADSRVGWLSIAAMVPMCGLLLIGGLYWRAKLKAIDGQSLAMRGVMRWADRLQVVLALSSVIVAALAAAGWMLPSLSVSLADRVVASFAAGLAVLEYVNYYHRQLQHFDHPADVRRLLAGRGFREAQMAADLRRYRLGQL